MFDVEAEVRNADAVNSAVDGVFHPLGASLAQPVLQAQSLRAKQSVAVFREDSAAGVAGSDVDGIGHATVLLDRSRRDAWSVARGALDAVLQRATLHAPRITTLFPSVRHGAANLALGVGL